MTEEPGILVLLLKLLHHLDHNPKRSELQFAFVKEGGESGLSAWADGGLDGGSSPEPRALLWEGVNPFLLSPQANSDLGSIALNLRMGFPAGRYDDGGPGTQPPR